ncbi:hypothetical protein F4818DRAFT_444623 [Hypoxylon cercidicola]|nr:hypothetical protein F4818DRAFT_444623 [Hypoxylon cercidicola]
MSPFGYSTTSEKLTKAFADKIKGRTFLVTGTTAGGLGANATIISAREYAVDPENARRLWELSGKLVGQKFDL